MNNLLGTLDILRTFNMKPNYSELSRLYGKSRLTIKRYYENGGKKVITRKRDSGFDFCKEEIIEHFKTKGASNSWLDELFGKKDSEVVDDDYDLSSALEKAAFVKKGDVWCVGRHKLMCGDAISEDDVNTLMGDKKANLILTDPPYGVSFKSSSGLTIQNDNIKADEFYLFLYQSFKTCFLMRKKVLVDMYSTQIQKDLILEKPLLMQVST